MYLVKLNKMDYSKYKTDGWGLSELSLKKLEDIIRTSENNTLRILEFGSGKSTMFLSDLNEIIDKQLFVTSFDNDETYSYKVKENDCVNLKIRQLEECSDSDYEKMFSDKKYNSELMYDKKSPLSTRQKNNFYKIEKGDINGSYDLIILDGPNGNGRNISYLHIINNVKKGTYILIDDFTHYDFVERLQSVLDSEEVFKHNDRTNGGEFVIHKIK
jgi:hypothetical protein